MTEQRPPIAPDRQTGLPRPPQAPRIYAGTAVTVRPLGRPRHALPAQEVWGPPLEWVTTSRREFCRDVAIALLLAGVVAALIWWGRGLTIGDHPVALAGTVGALTVLCWMWLGTREWLLAGARWVQHGKSWVSLYELTDVTADGVTGISLVDAAGRCIHRLDLTLAQRNQRLWDLVYNGIVAGIRAGTVVPDDTTALFLDLTPSPMPAAGGGDVGSDPVAEPPPRPINPTPWWIGALLTTLAAGFFGVVAVSAFVAPDPDLPTRMGVFFGALALILAMGAAGAWAVLRRSRTDPTALTTSLGPERWWSTPAFVVLCLLLTVAGVAVLDSALPVGVVMTVGGVVAPAWKLLESYRDRREGDPAGRGAHDAGPESWSPQ